MLDKHDVDELSDEIGRKTGNAICQIYDDRLIHPLAQNVANLELIRREIAIIKILIFLFLLIEFTPIVLDWISSFNLIDLNTGTAVQSG
jgi:hypothetical protein